MPDLPPKLPQAVTNSSRKGPPRNATRNPFGRRPRKNEAETTDNKVTPDRPATPIIEPPPTAPQPAVAAPEPTATQVATPDPQPPKGGRGSRLPRTNERNKPKRFGKQASDDKGVGAPASNDTPQNSVPPTPVVTTLSVEVSTASDEPTRDSRPPRGSGRKTRGRGGRSDAPGRNKRDSGKDKEMVCDKDTTKVVEDVSRAVLLAPEQTSNKDCLQDSSSSCDSSILTPTNSPSGSVGASKQRGSKSHPGAASTSKSQAGPAKPMVHEINYDTWAENPPSDTLWTMDAGDTLYSTPSNKAQISTPTPPNQPLPRTQAPLALPPPPTPPTQIAPNQPFPNPRPTQAQVPPRFAAQAQAPANLDNWAPTTLNDILWTLQSGIYANNPGPSSGVQTSTPTIPPNRSSPGVYTPPNRQPLPNRQPPPDRQPPPTPPSQIAPNQPPPAQPPIDESPTAIRRVGLAHVLLGPGACVQHVFTDAESPWIMISNLPRNTRKHHIQELVAPFGETRYVRVYDPKSDTQYLPTARVLFDRHESAKAAVSALQGHTMKSKRITVRLDTDASGARLDGGFVRGLNEAGSGNSEAGPQSSLIEHDPAAVLRSCTVKVAWYAPVASVYITYRDHRFAMERVKELTGRSFGNRRVQMKPVYSERDDLAKVGRENGGYVVRMDGLWANLDLDILGRFVRSQDLVVQPNYSSEAGLIKLRQDLSDIAPLESFKLLQNRREDKKYHAIAQYTTPAAAAAAVKVFEGRRGEYLANSPVWVSRHLTIKYSIPAKLTAALQGELNRLHSWSMDDPDLHVRQKDDIHKPGYVQISISGNETKHIASAKAQLDRALAGEPLRDLEGNKVWDAYFLSEAWAAFSESVAEQTGVCVRADQRTCSLLLFGPDYARDDASVLMRNELTRLAGLKRVLDIPPPVFRRLNAGGLTILRNLVGKGNIFINFYRQSLTFYGDEEVVRRVKKALDVMYSEVGAKLPRHSDCVVCLCQPEGSILLHCGHHYCRSCFSQYVASAAESRTLPLVCVGRNCKAQIPLSMITLHASQADQDALFYAAFQSHVAAHPEQYRYCPTPDCQYVYRVGQSDTSIQCRLCLVHICTYCHVEHHEGISCEDYLASHSESEIQKSFDRWREAHDVKNCPNCNASIEKIAGCNHMMCSVCRTHICWVCLSSFATGDKVYAHMRSAHGGIGL